MAWVLGKEAKTHGLASISFTPNIFYQVASITHGQMLLGQSNNPMVACL